MGCHNHKSQTYLFHFTDNNVYSVYTTETVTQGSNPRPLAQHILYVKQQHLGFMIYESSLKIRMQWHAFSIFSEAVISQKKELAAYE